MKHWNFFYYTGLYMKTNRPPKKRNKCEPPKSKHLCKKRNTKKQAHQKKKHKSEHIKKKKSARRRNINPAVIYITGAARLYNCTSICTYIRSNKS